MGARKLLVNPHDEKIDAFLPRSRGDDPRGLYLYMPVPEENPISTERVELGRRLNEFLTQRQQPLEPDVLQC